VREYTAKLFRESDLILVQEYLYTEFDWRIGILNNESLFACQYFMSPSHWQIVNHGESGQATEGAFKTWAIEDAPVVVVEVAKKSARLIGNGFYESMSNARDRRLMLLRPMITPISRVGWKMQYWALICIGRY